jgi:hypothetical protein
MPAREGLGQRRTQTKATANFNRTVLNRSLQLRLDCANVDAVTAAALLTAPREDFFEAYEISTAVNRVANDRPALLEPIAQSPTPARFTPTMPATAEAQMSAPAKRVKKTRKMRGKRRCFDCVLIDASCRRVPRHLPASNRLGNCVRCSRRQAADLA